MTTRRELLDAIETNGSENIPCLNLDTNTWYPDSKLEIMHELPVRLCQTCPIIETCLEYAMRSEERATGDRYGVWGGTTPHERTLLARRRKRHATPEPAPEPATEPTPAPAKAGTPQARRRLGTTRLTARRLG